MSACAGVVECLVCVWWDGSLRCCVEICLCRMYVCVLCCVLRCRCPDVSIVCLVLVPNRGPKTFEHEFFEFLFFMFDFAIFGVLRAFVRFGVVRYVIFFKICVDT